MVVPESGRRREFGWYWAADVLADLGAEVHLAHPLGGKRGNRRVKNNEGDATDLVDHGKIRCLTHTEAS